MKKLFSKLMLLALSAITFTACEDVPEPYDVPGTGSNVPGAIEIPGGVGEGTFETPFNAIAALNFGKKLETGQVSKNYMYIKGKVSKIESAFESNSYGNGTFYISNDGGHGNEFYVYRVNYLGNKKYAKSDTPVKLGDDVIICAKITNYNGTIETNQGEGFVYELNGVNRGGEILPSEESEDTPGEAAGDGTQTNPYNVAGVLAFINTLGEKTSDNVVYVKGKISKIEEEFGTQFGNATFNISDEGTSNWFKAYQVYHLGNKKYTGTETQIKLGDEVIVCGKVVNFKGNTPETAAKTGYLYSLNGVTEGTDNPEPPQPTGDNILTNGDFETWTNGLPDHWKTTSTAGNATLEQSSDAHGGSYSVSVGFNTTQNKRLAHEEITLKAGTYTFSFYAKSTTAEKSQTQAGYVEVTNGTAGSYKYGGYTSLTNTEWTLVSTTFTLSSQASIALVMMNPKTSDYATAQNILVDDASLVTSDGGIVDGESGGEPTPQPQPAGDSYTKVTTIAEGNYIIAANTSGDAYALAVPLDAGKTYGYIQKTDVTASNGAISTSAANEFTFKATDGGYTIQDASGRYYYMTGTFNSFNVSDGLPSEGYVWEVSFQNDNVVIKNVLKGKTLQYSTQYSSYGAYSSITNTLPILFKK
jgi:hypothetical protein